MHQNTWRTKKAKLSSNSIFINNGYNLTLIRSQTDSLAEVITQIHNDVINNSSILLNQHGLNSRCAETFGFGKQRILEKSRIVQQCNVWLYICSQLHHCIENAPLEGYF